MLGRKHFSPTYQVGPNMYMAVCRKKLLPLRFLSKPLVRRVCSGGITQGYYIRYYAVSETETNRTSIFYAATRQVLQIIIENQYSNVLQLAKCCKTTTENQSSGVLQLAKCCKLQYKIYILVCCNCPSTVNYNRTSVFWCTATRQVLKKSK